MTSVNPAIPERLSAVIDLPSGTPVHVEVDQLGRVLSVRVVRDDDRLPAWPQLVALGRRALLQAWELGSDFGDWPPPPAHLAKDAEDYDPYEHRTASNEEVVDAWRYGIRNGRPVEETAAFLGMSVRVLQDRLSRLRSAGHDLPKAKRGPRPKRGDQQ